MFIVNKGPKIMSTGYTDATPYCFDRFKSHIKPPPKKRHTSAHVQKLVFAFCLWINNSCNSIFNHYFCYFHLYTMEQTGAPQKRFSFFDTTMHDHWQMAKSLVLPTKNFYPFKTEKYAKIQMWIVCCFFSVVARYDVVLVCICIVLNNRNQY